MRIHALLGLASVMIASGVALGACAANDDGTHVAEQRPLGFGDSVYATTNPRIVLVPLDESAYNPGGPCWQNYEFDATASGPRTITINETRGKPSPQLPEGAACTGAAIAGIYQRIHLPSDYHDQTFVDAANGRRVRVLQLPKEQRQQMYPPVG